MKISLQWPYWRSVLSFVLYEAGWYACVKAAALGAMGWGIAAAAVSIAWELTISRRRGADLLLMAVAVGTGLLWDTLLVQTHLVTYASHEPFTAIAPLWMLVLWAQLGSVLRAPLRWLHTRKWLAAGLGAVGGAASYAAGVRIGAVAFSNYPVVLAVIAAGWSAMTPMLLAVTCVVQRTVQPSRDA